MKGGGLWGPPLLTASEELEAEDLERRVWALVLQGGNSLTSATMMILCSHGEQALLRIENGEHRPALDV